MNYCFSRFGVLIFCSMFFFTISLPDRALTGPGEKVDVKIMQKEVIGKYLADHNGMTLYRFTRDADNSSNCSEGCAVNWPPFHGDLSAVGEDLELDDFGVITRTDGRQQTTYRGMPLYYFKNDKYPGDTFGDGIGDAWYLVKPTKQEKPNKEE